MHRTPLIHTLGRLAAALGILAGLLLLLGTGTAAAQDVPLPARLTNVASSFEASNVPDHYIRHRNTLGEISRISSELDRADATWRMRPALSGTAGAVSFESVNYPGTFLRHQAFRLKQHPNDNSDLFKKDASFIVRAGLAGGGTKSFEAVNEPGFFIRHQNFELYIAKSDGSDLFKQDASFHERGGFSGAAPRIGTTAARPGSHTVTLEVSQSRWLGGIKSWDGFFEVSCVEWNPFPGPLDGHVGWGQAQWGDDPCTAVVLEDAVLFDTAPLDRIPEKHIDRAVLTYDEAPGAFCGLVYGGSIGCWQNGRGAREDKPNGCVVVRIPSRDWITTDASPQGPLPYINGPRPAVTRLGPRAWDVTEPYRWQTVPGAMPLQVPGGPAVSKGFGFLLTGEPSLDQLTAEDNTVCVSLLSNIRLQVTYTVPDDEPFRAPR